jgi:aminocarboxymuconate-semialdehyde decarboxylase
MMRNYNLHKDTLADPSKALSMLYYDTLLHDPDALAFLIRAVGIDRIMLGSDMPFPIGDPSPLAVLDGLDMADRNKLVNGVASQLFGL